MKAKNLTSRGPAAQKSSEDAVGVLLLLGSQNRALDLKLHAYAASVATSIDLTDDFPRLRIEDPVEFVAAIKNEFAPDQHKDIRLAFASTDSTRGSLIQQAMAAPTLADHDTNSSNEIRGLRPKLSIQYQPIVKLSDRSVVGYEALLRASSRGKRISTDSVFVSADRGGWLGELDQLSRILALEGLGPWIGKGLLFLNMTAPEGRFDLEAANTTIDKAMALGLEPDQIVLEAVEHNRYLDIASAASQIAEIRSRGVRIAIDDVGDGHSDLRVIAEFRPDIIKISGNLIAKLETRQARSIVRTLIEMAHRDNSWVVAEGIETKNQLAVLQTMGADWGQGLLLGGPRPQSKKSLVV